MIKLITPKEACKVLCHPEIYDVISDDNSIPADEFEPSEDCEYIGGFIEDKLFAVMIYHEFRDGVKLHIQVLPEYREHLSIEFGRDGLEYGLSKNIPIYCDIPKIYPNVKRYAESFGFEVIEAISQCTEKNGIIGDSELLKYMS